MEYTFSVSNDTLNGKVDLEALEQQISLSPITISIDGGCRTEGDVLTCPFLADLGLADRQALGTVVAQHDGEPLQTDTVSINDLGHVEVEVAPRSGLVYEYYSINLADPTTWHSETTRILGAVCVDTGDGLSFNIPGVIRGVLDVTHAKITQEIRLSAQRLIVYVDGVESPEEEYGWADYEANPGSGIANPFEEGEWTCDYSTGVITFKQAPSGVVTCDWDRPESAFWYVEPLDGMSLALLTVEVNATLDIEMRDSVMFIPQVTYKYIAELGQLDATANAIGITAETMEAAGLPPGDPGCLLLASKELEATPFYEAAAAQLGITAEQFKASQGLPVPDLGWVDVAEDTREYKRIQDFIVESQRSFPNVPQLGAGTLRGMSQEWFIFRWPYSESAARSFIEMRTRLKIGLKHGIPFAGEYAGISVYALASEVKS